MQIERKLKLMIEQKEHFHGSDLEKIEKIYGIKKENIVSFAATVSYTHLDVYKRQSIRRMKSPPSCFAIR